MNQGLATLRTLRCSGGSIVMTTRIELNPGSACVGSSAGASVMPGSLRNLSGCFEIEVMSACFVIAQKGLDLVDLPAAHRRVLAQFGEEGMGRAAPGVKSGVEKAESVVVGHGVPRAGRGES